MQASLIISIVSIVIAIVSIVITTTDRRLKENPFFIFESQSYISKFSSDVNHNSISYNFIKVSTEKEQLEEIKKNSIHKYHREIHLSEMDSTYLKILNVGGIGKEIKITTTCQLPDINMREDLSDNKGVKVKFEEPTNIKPEKHSVMTYLNGSVAGQRVFFELNPILISDNKGINTNGYLSVKIPDEFILFTNLFLENILFEPPKLNFCIEGKNVYNKKFKDNLTLVVERYNYSFSSDFTEIQIDIVGK